MSSAISHKLRSQRGASLLLALLFLLVCSMVAASILMAAAANAGKYRSNLEEHQTYLALSSAITTLCEELNRSEYRGQYYSWKQTYHSEDDKEITEYYFQQIPGSYTHINPATGDGCFKSMVLADLDSIFYAETQQKLSGTHVIQKTESNISSHTIAVHTFLLTPDDNTHLNQTPVHMTLEVKPSYAIYITAYLDGLEVYKIEAELTPAVSAPTLPLSLTYQGSNVIEQTSSMQWKLGWITIANQKTEGTETGG